MTLTAQTKIGLTFGQILSLITITGAFVMGYRDLDLRINQLEQKSIITDKQIVFNGTEIERVRTENRQDHAIIFGKFDQIILTLKK